MRRLLITSELTFSGPQPGDDVREKLQRNVADAITHVLRREGFPHLAYFVSPDWVGVRWVEREPPPEVAEIVRVLAETAISSEDKEARRAAILAMAERLAAVGRGDAQ